MSSTLQGVPLETSRQRRWPAAILPFLVGAAWLLSLFGPLLSPGRALANRDIAVFHLPLRASFQALAKLGLPVWNPWLHGGQPILSNPTYAAFYPPSWLVCFVSPEYALSLIAVLHAGIAFAGAWKLARRLGCGRGPAMLAGVGYVGSGACLSLFSAYPMLGGMAWLPWILAWADQSLREEHWRRPALLAGAALGLQILNGEPTTMVLSGLGLIALTASARRLAAVPRMLVPLLFAASLAAVQLLPTLGRFEDSPRSEVPSRIATVWSMPPARLVEIVFPRFFGDPTRDAEGLFFGRGLNDRDYPYIESLYPGLLLAVMGGSALLLGRVPRRAAWALAFVTGVFLALGRNNPVYEGLREAIPVLAVLRYPEKFILLSLVALVFAGALGWQRLLDERDAGRPASFNPPLALALLLLVSALALTGLILWAPGIASRHTASLGIPPSSTALSYLQGEGWAAVRTAAVVALLLALCRWRRPGRRLLEGLAVLLLAADLWRYGHGLVLTLPAGAYRTPPPLAVELLPVSARIFVQEPQPGATQFFRREGDPRTVLTRSYLERLEPYSAALWHIPEAFESDFELMLTGWGRTAARILQQEGFGSQESSRYLGAWNVGTLFLQKTFIEQVAELRDPYALPMHRIVNAYVLPRFRFVREVRFHPAHPEALAAARAQGWRVARRDHWVRPGAPESGHHTRPPRVLEIVDAGGRIELRYQAEEGAFFVAATTYDEQWRAQLDGEPLAAYPTAACQLGVVLPPGEHRLVLRYRDPLLGLGAAVSLTALVLGAVLSALGRGGRWMRVESEARH